MKKAIAMKCTQEQWDSIKDRIPEDRITNLESCIEYITNIYFGDKISNIGFGDGTYKGIEIHETFNAKLFLEACGIETDVYEITKEQVLEMSSWGNSRDIEKVKQWFPDAFKKELEVGKWYKNPNVGSIGFCEVIIDNNSFLGYGFGNNFSNNKWFDKSDVEFTCSNWQEATPQEVEDALISEANKRGYNNENYSCLLLPESTHKVKNNYHFNIITNQLFQGKSAQHKNNVVFDSGIWATIIQPEKMTLEQIEKELGRKIEIV